MDKEAADALATYLEPDNNGAATNYSGITLNSTLSEISWGTLKPELYREGVPVINDINETTASITLEYQISSQNDQGQLEIYDVKEFYRMRYDSRVFLLDFQRSANQVFDYVELGNNFSIYEIAPLPEWIGHSIRDINDRVKYNANIIGIKAENGMELMPNAEYVFRRDEHLMIIGHKRDMEKILKKL